MGTVYVFFADGFEEIEAISVIDICRRAGIEVVTAGVEDKVLIGAHNIKIEMDKKIDEVKSSDFDMIVLPGGLPNAFTLAENSKVQSLLKEFKNKNKKEFEYLTEDIDKDKALIISEKQKSIYNLHGIDFTIGYLKGGFDAWKAAGQEVDTIESISADQLADLIKKESNAKILDVRKKSEHFSEHIIGSENAPLDFINDSMAQIDKSKTYYKAITKSKVESLVNEQKSPQRFQREEYCVIYK